MKLTREFQTNPNHHYADGVVVQSAKFGRSQADLWQDSEPSPIWRGDPKKIVGHWPGLLWHYCVHGELSGIATTEAAAKSMAERRAWDSEANARTRRHDDHLDWRHQLSPAADQAEKAAFQKMLAEVDKMYPADAATAQKTDDTGIKHGL